MAKNSIKIYGNITDWNENNAREVCAKIDALQGADVIKLHLHCYGGNVFEGNLIYNAIKQSKTPIDIYIDGVAASMGAILTTAARRVYMAENAFIMIHAPANPVTAGRGTAEEHIKTAKLLRAMQNNFIKALSARTEQNEEVLKGWLAGDNWFSAPEALSEKLIDEIIRPAAALSETLTTEEVKTSEISKIYGLFAASLELPKKRNLKPIQMDKIKLIERYKLKGVTAENSDDEILAAVDAIISAEKNAREKAEDTLKEQTEKQINALLDGLTLSPDQRAQFTEIGQKAGVDALATAIEPLKKPVPKFTDILKGQHSAPSVSATWDELDKNGGLYDLKKNNPDRFRDLYVAKFGHEPETY